jgi:DNA-binding SARP family transcriptional activator
MCFLLSRPGFSATRDAVLEAMWPDLEPEVAVNSLNQTMYFLRRVFEDHYNEDLSPGYVHHDSDVLWLDHDLVDSRSALCRRLLRSMGSRPNPESIAELSRAYVGKFALDFAYDDWADSYRDSLHAAYLEAIESSSMEDTNTGHFDRAIRVVQRAIEVDPEADHLEASLLRLYELSGSHAAAAEQYGHYASALRRDLGIEAPPLDRV